MVVIACFSFRLFGYCWAAGRSIACDSGAEGGRPDGWLVGFTTATHMTAHERTQPSSLGPYIAKFPSGTGNSGDFALVCMACLMSHALAVGERSLGGRMNERAEDLRFSVWRRWRDCWIVSHADGGRKVG